MEKIFTDQQLMNKLADRLGQTERVLSHNDLHLGNILICKKRKRVYLIDFEFAQFNYIGFDIGNFLNEWSTEYGEKAFEIRESW